MISYWDIGQFSFKYKSLELNYFVKTVLNDYLTLPLFPYSMPSHLSILRSLLLAGRMANDSTPWLVNELAHDDKGEVTGVTVLQHVK